MSLAAYTVRRAEAPLPGGHSVLVRGLSPADLVTLYHAHKEGLRTVYETFLAEAGEKSASAILAEAGADGLIPEDSEMGATMRDLFIQAPDFFGAVIALAADEPDQAEKAAALPFGAILSLLSAILELTLEDEGGLEKLAGTVASLSGKARPQRNATH